MWPCGNEIRAQALHLDLKFKKFDGPSQGGISEWLPLISNVFILKVPKLPTPKYVPEMTRIHSIEFLT